MVVAFPAAFLALVGVAQVSASSNGDRAFIFDAEGR